MKNRLDTHNIVVEYCPTEEMLADFYTKPLQGALFRKFRDVIMGLKHISILIRTPTLTDQERVGNNVGLESNSEPDNIDQNIRTVREKDRKTNNVRNVVHDAGASYNQAKGNIQGSMTGHDATINIPAHRKSYADIVRS